MPGQPLPADPDVLSVSDLTKSLKELLEGAYPAVSVTGEISNFKHHSSGHMYFSLKDKNSQLRCIMWRWQNQSLKFAPEDGMQVVLRGNVTVYEAQGQYQLVAKSMQPAGEGALQIAFEQLKARLAAEGLFEHERKRPVPEFPGTIGVVTSPTGAAVRDIIRVLRRRAPWVHITLWPVRVQGEGAATEIAAAIQEANRLMNMDVIIVGRGGGSMEDLWAFNEEVVVRAIAASDIPTVSAVGHEVDVTLSDFAADMRAATPSAAAELVVRDHRELTDRLRSSFSRLHNAITTRISHRRQHVNGLLGSHGMRRPLDLLLQRSQRVDEITRRIMDSVVRQTEYRGQVLSGLAGRLNALNPLGVLERGYSVCRTPKGVVIRNADDLKDGDRLNVRFHKGEASCRVESTGEDPPKPRRKRRKDAVASEENPRLDLFDE